MISVRGVVAAEFSQFYFRVGEGGTVHIPWESSLGLVRENDIGQVMLTTVRQFGRVCAEAQLCAGVPALDPAWTDVVEFSVTAGTGATIDPWDPGDTGFAVPVAPGTTYRVRVVIIDGEAGSQQFRDDPQALPLELYLLQLWPQPVGAPQVVRSESPWAQYWVHGGRTSG